MTVASERSLTLTTADGLNLRAWLAAPASPRAALILFHGLTTDASEHGMFPALRDRAVAAGLAVLRFDARAHGASDGANEQLRLAGLRADADAAVAAIDEHLGPELPVIPLGVSFGGAAAVHTAATRPPCAGLALWYAVLDYEWNYGPSSPVPFTQQMRAAADPERDPEWATMPVLGTDYHFPRSLLEEMTSDRTVTTLASLTVPVLAYHGSRDTFVSLQPVRHLARHNDNIELRIAYGAGHGFLLWRPWVVRHTARWASRVAEPRAIRG